MLKATTRLWQAAALSTDLLRANLPQRWFDKLARPHVGLAISGGVDSMALSTLCSKLRKTPEGSDLFFTAFIVDHELRPGSADEALTVAKNLEQLDIPSQIITLDPKQYGDAHATRKIESVARRLRYRALGRECRSRGITDLLFAHHADDQAETTLMRLTNNYLGRGLAGMQREAGIPECEDMYGVHKSGTPRALRRELDLSDHPRASHQNLVESGGIFILRPLLSYTKDRLIATCEEASVRWVEDHTNKDRSLTMRNTVRYLHEADRLPVALRRPNLGAIAARVFEQTTRLEIRVDELFRGFDVTFDPRSGHVVCRIPHKTANEINAMPDCDHVRAILLRKLLLLVAPAENMELSTLEAASSAFLRSNEGHDNASSKVITVAGAIAERLEDDTGTMVYELRRALPPRNAKGGRPEVRISLSSNTQQGLLTPVSWSDWYLWDERYWIRIGSCVHESLNVVVRLLTPADVAALRGKLQGTPRDKYVELRLRKIKGHLRSTLPVLVQILPDKRERIVALPTLRWRRDEWFPADLENGHLTARLYEIRYKQIDKSLSEPIEAI